MEDNSGELIPRLRLAPYRAKIKSSSRPPSPTAAQALKTVELVVPYSLSWELLTRQS